MSRAPAIFLISFVVAACGSGARAEPSTSPETPITTATAPPTLAQGTPDSSAHAFPAFAADEPLVAFNRVTGAGGGVFVAKPDGTGIQQLAQDVLPGVHKRIGWSPDGQRIVFIDETTERMWIANLDGSPTEPVAACDTPGCDFPAWSPDGSRIAFSRVESGSGFEGPAAVGIHVVDLATGKVSDVVTLKRPHLADVPRWSPDGSQIVFSVDQMDDEAYETGAAIAIVPVTGGEPRYLTEFDQFASQPDWGVTDEIVFSEDLLDGKREPGPGDDTRDLFGIQPDGSGLRQITHAATGQQLRGPRWAPDGSAITSYEVTLGGGILVDPKTGSFQPFVTSGEFARPVIRPLPTTP